MFNVNIGGSAEDNGAFNAELDKFILMSKLVSKLDVMMDKLCIYEKE